jgi:hypothetical protein
MSIPARSAYANGSVASIQAPSSRSAEKSGRSIGKVMSAVLILLIPLIIGVGGTLGVLASQGHFSSAPATTKKVVVAQVQATPAATPAATAAAQGNQLPTPTSFKLASVKDVNVALEYPSSWVQDALQKSTDGTSLGIHPPQTEQIGISFFLMRFSTSTSATISNPDQINQSNVQQFSQLSGVSDMQTLPSTSPAPMIGGISWTELDASFMNSSNVKLDLMSMSVDHNKIYYNIAVVVPDVYYTEAMQKYIEHMYTTFKFLS